MKTPLEQREAGRKADDVLARKQVEALVEQLRGEGRQVAADLVEDLITNLDLARGRIAALTAKPKRQTVKTSGGKERASATGTINASGKAVHGAGDGRGVGIGGRDIKPASPDHKHDYGSDGLCRRRDGLGLLCMAKRQRQSKKSKQTVIPGTDGAKASSTSEAGS